MIHRSPFSTLPPFWRGFCEGWCIGAALAVVALGVLWAIGVFP
jgi:hypothetical protein